MSNCVTVTIHRPAKFAAIGFLNTCLDVGLFWILATLIELPILLANTISYSVSVINSFFWNKYWTFGDIDQRDPFIRQFFLFVTFNVISLVISNLLVWLGAQVMSPLAAKLVSVGGTLIWNYLTSKFFVYRSYLPTN